MNSLRPKTSAILDQLKDFQRATVDHVFRRMYLDADYVRRFLIADEVGLGKTLVARGLIAKAIELLWDRNPRIDIIYVCSNTDIARQNINRLNVTGQDDFALSSRITLLPVTIQNLEKRRVNFVSFTPGTSFDVGNSPGWSYERELLYWLLAEAWEIGFAKATCILHATAKVEGFRQRVRDFPRKSIHRGIAQRFAAQLCERDDLQKRFVELCDKMPRAGFSVPWDTHRERNALIGDLRRLLAQTCLQWLEPDLIILDEFQRFKYLLEGDSEEASEAAQLAHHLFDYQQSQDDPLTAARVLLLSATPYKMYTQAHEAEQDDHYEDFRNTLDFLLPEGERRQCCYRQIDQYREALLRLPERGPQALAGPKRELEESLSRVMVRTERLALSEDRNGMLTEIIPDGVVLSSSDVRKYIDMQRIARSLGHDDVLDYWKSAPYLLNFMEEYELKRKLLEVVEATEQDRRVVRSIRGGDGVLLSREDVQRYRKLDPANARLRGLCYEMIEQGMWRLLWIPPALPYHQGVGAYADEKLANVTKRLVFSCWRVVPKAVSAVLSYEVERSMMQQYRRTLRNTPEARKKRRALLRFTFSKGRPTGMPVLALLYPCSTLTRVIDPLRMRKLGSDPSGLPTLASVVGQAETAITDLLRPLVSPFVDKPGPPDESWYWAAPILLDTKYDPAPTYEWFAVDNLAKTWASGLDGDDQEAAAGWTRHVRLAQRTVRGEIELGPPPSDLARTLAYMAIAGPGVVARRSLERVSSGDSAEHRPDLRSFAAPLAHAFLSLFNLPEVMAMLRDRTDVSPYWRSVLEHCAAGNLQAVMDEYCHLLIEAMGLVGKDARTVAAEVSGVVRRCLTMRTSTAQADVITVGKRRIQLEEPLRMRTRFAMRFGDQDVEDSAEPTRADHVRTAFNSPFWPFVLTTTSVGQEGLDFHMYCHAVVHWNLPSNPVDMEQREGRVHRYKGHAVRKNVAARYATAAGIDGNDPWAEMFEAARVDRAVDQNDLYPFWIVPNGDARIERHVPALPHSREAVLQSGLRRSLVLYRMVFGQSRQEDLLDYLLSYLPEAQAREVAELCRIDLSPPVLPEITQEQRVMEEGPNQGEVLVRPYNLASDVLGGQDQP